MRKHYDPSPEKWFLREGKALAGIGQEGLKEIREKNVKTIVLPSVKDGLKLERLVPDSLCRLKAIPKVVELVIPGDIKIQGLTTTSGRDCWDFPNSETIKRLVFVGQTPINFYRYQRVFDESLESISIQESERFRSIDGVIYSKDRKNLVYYPRSKKNKKYIVPSCVKGIWCNAFRDVKYLEELVLPAGLEDISKEAFKNSSIKRIEIPGSVSFVFENAFDSCQLESLVLHEGIRWIGRNAFRECNPSEVKFPISLQSIEQNAFMNSKSAFIFQTDQIQIGIGAFYGITHTQLLAAGKHTRKKIIGTSFVAPIKKEDENQITRDSVINMIKILCGSEYPIDDNQTKNDLIALFNKIYEDFQN